MALKVTTGGRIAGKQFTATVSTPPLWGVRGRRRSYVHVACLRQGRPFYLGLSAGLRTAALRVRVLYVRQCAREVRIFWFGLPFEELGLSLGSKNRKLLQCGCSVKPAHVRLLVSLSTSRHRTNFWLFRIFSGLPTGSGSSIPPTPTSAALTSKPKERPGSSQKTYTPAQPRATCQRIRN